MSLAQHLAEIERLSVFVAPSSDAHAQYASSVRQVCNLVRRCVSAGDCEATAIAATLLGESLARLREMARQRDADLAEEALFLRPIVRAHSEAVKRRTAFLAARQRGLSVMKAYEIAARKCGTSVKTIMRAVNGH